VLVKREGQQRSGRHDHIGVVHDEFALLAAQVGHAALAAAAAAAQGFTLATFRLDASTLRGMCGAVGWFQ